MKAETTQEEDVELKQPRDLVQRLKAPKVIDAKASHTRMPTELELEAAGMIDSLLFQLEARIGVEAAKKEPSCAPTS